MLLDVIAQTHNVWDNSGVEGVESIGQRIKRERMARNMTQRELAEVVGVGVPHISKVEAGRENPSDGMLSKVAAVLGCSYEELLLAAHRLPSDLMEQLAENPARSLEFLRTWQRDDR